MVWAATEGAPFRLRDGKAKDDKVQTVGLAPVPFNKLDEEELRRLGGSAIVILKTPAEARAFEAKAKARGEGRAANPVRVKTAVHNARIIARRKRLAEEALVKLVRERMEKDPEATWQVAIKEAIAYLRRPEEPQRAAASPGAAPRRGGRRGAPELEVSEDDDEEDGSPAS